MTETSPIKELVLTRVFDAPRELVFKAWIDPKHMAKWWGPHGYTAPICELDARVGGALRIHMEGPTGNHPMTGIFKEVVPPEKLVFTAVVPDPQGKVVLENLNTVIFEAQGHKTEITLTVNVLHSTDAATQMLAGMETGWSQSLEKLAALVAQG